MKHTCQLLVLLLAFPIALGAQAGTNDTSPHTQHFVRLEPAVRLEILDWGGSGRPIVLLAGRGNTAHVFDDLAPKLVADYHVYGVTRRGYGNSSATLSGFLADSLGDDVLAVMDSLGIFEPVLIGHSIAGQELSSIGSRYPERVAGLVYLDAGFHFAFYDSSLSSPVSLRDTQRKLARLADPSVGMTVGERQAIMQELLQSSLPFLERDLGLWQQGLAAYADQSATLPAPDSNPLNRALALGQQKYTAIRAPVLAIFAVPRQIPASIAGDSVARARFDSLNIAGLSPQVNAFERGIPSARVVRLSHANHYVFRSHETDVLREIRAFIDGLPSGAIALEPEPWACRPERAGAITYIVDGRLATCRSAMGIPHSRIASVEVLKGAAAAQFAAAAAGAVIIIETNAGPPGGVQ